MNSIKTQTGSGAAGEMESRRAGLLAAREAREANLPLKFWNQQAHFTTPANGKPGKAIRGLKPAGRLLERFAISVEELAEASGAPAAALAELIDSDRPFSPLVMVDAEDAIALTRDSTRRAREGAARVFADAEWGPALAFYRPAGLAIEACIEDLRTVLAEAGRGRAPADYPVDGVIWPKVESVEEIVWVCDLLGEIERGIGLAPNRIRLEFLVESGRAVERALDIAEACAGRLAGIIWGIADYSADVGLPAIRHDHPVADWAKARIVNAAGAMGVPAIDAMTLNYPTAIHRGEELSERQRGENREKVLGALCEVYRDARRGLELGMSGKWVGHPLQLLMALAAYRGATDEGRVRADLTEIEAYRASVAAGAGAAILGEGAGSYMADRATDRHLRARLRRAAAWGAIEPERAWGLGLITEAERGELTARRSAT